MAGCLRFLFMVLCLSRVVSAQSVREEILVEYPSRHALPAEGKKIITIRMPSDWVLSDTSVVSLLKSLSASPDPYYLMNPVDSGTFRALIWKKELAPMLYQYVVSEVFPDGSVKRYDVLQEKGKKNGTHNEFWSPGVIKEVGAYMNGKPDGDWQYYDSIGRLLQTRRYSVGDKEKERIVKRPHATWYSAIVARTPVKPYTIIPNTAEKQQDPVWKIDERRYAQVWSFTLGGGFNTRSGLSSVNYPSMIGQPEDNGLNVFLELMWWDPEKWFATYEFRHSLMGSSEGLYMGTNVRSSCVSRHYGFAGGHGIFSGPRWSLAGSIGMTLATADLKSKDLDDSNQQGDSYFELSSLKQGPMISPSLLYDLRFPFRGKVGYGLYLKASYHIAISEAKWHLLDSPLKNREDANLGGFFISLGLKVAKLRRV